MQEHEGIGPGTRGRREEWHSCCPCAMGTRISGIIMVALGLLASGGALANNLGLTNVTIRPVDDHTVFAQFDIRWENSWRHTNINHDAAWVFFKIKPEGRSAWEHVTLETNGHVAGTGTAVEIVVPSDRVGCFIRRAGEGSGPLSVTNVKVAWNFASNSLVKTDRVRLQVCALEMVYVAQGAFYVGTGSTNEQNSFTDGSWGGGTNYPIPFRITNEVELTLTNTAGNLWAKGAIVAGILSNAFPKGYGAFYCMKYEITQGQYRDFLNSLTRRQQWQRTASQNPSWFAMSGGSTPAYREGIRCPTVVPFQPLPLVFGCDANGNNIMNETNDAMDRACNYLSWAHGAAFGDWAGLRPMTELEFEKACRGPLAPVTNEFAWGDAIFVSQTGHTGADGSGQERASPATANCNIDNKFQGPVRVGIYATTNSTRQAAGATYWGIMELGGNLGERVVAVGSAAGRGFSGWHGDGRLDVNGNANVTGWPGTDAAGSGHRSGNWSGTFDFAPVSARNTATTGDNWLYCVGWRGVRTAPAGVEP